MKHSVLPAEHMPLYEGIASQIGIKASEVHSFVETTRELGLCMHGIKRASSIASVRDEGIRPLTPEGGNVSFWATGLAIFHGAQPTDTRLIGYDTPFFDYSISRRGSGVIRMVAVATKDDLMAIDSGLQLPESVDSQLTISEPVPSDILRFAQVEGLDVQTTNLALFHELLRVAENK